jgi:hypothetical protein
MRRLPRRRNRAPKAMPRCKALDHAQPKQLRTVLKLAALL